MYYKMPWQLNRSDLQTLSIQPQNGFEYMNPSSQFLLSCDFDDKSYKGMAAKLAFLVEGEILFFSLECTTN